MLPSGDCDSNCTDALCGDGTINTAAGEACDDSGESSTCTVTCETSSCGDGYINQQAGEVCDDGNTDDDDGCDADCSITVGVSAVVAGDIHTCALNYTGDVRCWGEGDDGRLGYGDTDNVGDVLHPSSAGDVDVGGDVTQIALGDDFTCALLDTGDVRCWGGNAVGQLGLQHTNSIGDDEHPASASVVSLSSAAVAVTAGGTRACPSRQRRHAVLG